MEESGGFGRFQAFAAATFIMVFITNAHIFYSIPYLVLFPHYKCPADYKVCDYTVACGDPNIVVDKDYEWSLDNWVSRFNL
jgi:hypothetical protein